MQERLTEVETQLAFHDHLLQQLNDVVAQQQKQIDAVQHELAIIREQMAGLRESLVAVTKEPLPPHY